MWYTYQWRAPKYKYKSRHVTTFHSSWISDCRRCVSLVWNRSSSVQWRDVRCRSVHPSTLFAYDAKRRCEPCWVWNSRRSKRRDVIRWIQCWRIHHDHMHAIDAHLCQKMQSGIHLQLWSGLRNRRIPWSLHRGLQWMYCRRILNSYDVIRKTLFYSR